MSPLGFYGVLALCGVVMTGFGCVLPYLKILHCTVKKI
jgi:hypothetical protein